MKTAYYNISIGILQMIYDNDVLYSLNLVNAIESNNEKSDFTDKVYGQISDYLDGKRSSFDINYKLIGTPFQESVWRILETIPYGKTKTYGEIAFQLGNPKLSRAVGNACNKNHIWLIVPCHRVIGANGKLTGYAGGLEIKRYLLNLEKENKNSIAH